MANVCERGVDGEVVVEVKTERTSQSIFNALTIAVFVCICT